MIAYKTFEKSLIVKIAVFVFVVFALFPIDVSAAVCPDGGGVVSSTDQPENFADFVCILTDGINSLIPVIIGLTLLVFLWGLAKFILAGGDEKNIQVGKDLMFWGVVGLFIMVSVWGIVNIVYGTFFDGSTIKVDLLPTPGDL